MVLETKERRQLFSCISYAMSYHPFSQILVFERKSELNLFKKKEDDLNKGDLLCFSCSNSVMADSREIREGKQFVTFLL